MKPSLTLTVFGMVASCASAIGASAQPAPPLLNVLEVRRLVASETASDATRLSAHFSALAYQFARDAKRHRRMPNTLGGNPNHQLPSQAAHCRVLADRDDDSAAVLREVAAHYERVASGFASTLPASAIQFQQGFGAPMPTKQEVQTLASTANTAADHEALRDYFRSLEKRYVTDAADHSRRARHYLGTRLESQVWNCQRLARVAREKAREAAAAAAEHEQMSDMARDAQA